MDGEYAWSIYWRLRNEGGVTYQEIDAYLRVTGDRLSTWEIELIRRLDAAENEWRGEQIRGRRGQTGNTS